MISRVKNPFALASRSLRDALAGVNSAIMARVIDPSEWHGNATVALARALLGKVLVRTRGQGEREARVILETEAYVGPHDLACHASKGCTTRTEVMFGPGGVWYVYLCYGIELPRC